MKLHHIGLDALVPHGKAEARAEDGALKVWTTHSIASVGNVDFREKRHFVSLPGKYRLPFKVEMRVKLDFPAFYLLVGEGHIAFASPGQDNRKMEDIHKCTGKPNQDHGGFDNSLPLGEYADIELTFALKEMQIVIGGEERFYSRSQAYMRARDLAGRNEAGFELGLAVSKRSALCIQNIRVTELEEGAPIPRAEGAPTAPSAIPEEGAKPTFESAISTLPPSFQQSLSQMDAYLMGLRPLKFKRALDKRGCKVAYVAPGQGMSYTFEVCGPRFSHHLNWYIVYNGKPETWHRKADDMEAVLAEISKTDPGLASRMFEGLNDCVNCMGPRCLAKTRYEYNGQVRITCHGRVMLRMCGGDFQDAKEFFHHLNRLIARRMEEGMAPPEKIFLKRR